MPQWAFWPTPFDADEKLALLTVALDSLASWRSCWVYKRRAGWTFADKSKWVTYEELAAQYNHLLEKYPIVSIEDPFAEDDWEAWSYFYKTSDFQIVGDDLTVTNPIRIKKAIELKSCNALLLKVNQIGTLTESIQAAKM